MTLIFKFQEEYSSVTLSTGHMLREEVFGCDKRSLENSVIGHRITFPLNYPTVCRYTENNTAATPLNNAQPWRLFLYLNSERLHG